jgi:hypothetical protein
LGEIGDIAAEGGESAGAFRGEVGLIGAREAPDAMAARQQALGEGAADAGAGAGDDDSHRVKMRVRVKMKVRVKVAISGRAGW